MTLNVYVLEMAPNLTLEERLLAANKFCLTGPVLFRLVLLYMALLEFCFGKVVSLALSKFVRDRLIYLMH